MMIGSGTSMKRRLFRHLAFIGGLDDSLAEYQDFIVTKGEEADVVAGIVAVLFDVLKKEWDILQLGMVPLQSHCFALLRAAVANDALRLANLKSQQCRIRSPSRVCRNRLICRDSQLAASSTSRP